MTTTTRLHRATPGEKMRQVLEMRYLHNMTLEQVGDALGVTRERARQIEAKAIRIIKNNRTLREKAEAVLQEINER